MTAKAQILLVDDDLGLQKIYGKRLQVAGYDVVAVLNGEEALAQAKKSPPALIILDVMLPKLNGYEVCARLKQDPATKQIPVIMFTAKGEPQQHIAGLMLGANAYLNKNCESETLLEQVKSLVAKAMPSA